MNNALKDLPTPAECFAKLQSDGFVELPGVVDPGFLAECRAFIDSELEKRGHRYFSIENVKDTPGAPFGALTSDSSLRELVAELCRMAKGEDAALDLAQGNNLRVIAGEKSSSQAMKFHYDSDVLTVLFPVMIPDGTPEEAGDLIALTNHRPFGRSALVNLVQKAIIQNRFYRERLARRVRDGKAGARVIKLKPGNLLLFWGYRTLHANFPCRSEAVRATMLSFWGDPHPNDRIMKFAADRRNRMEARIREQGA